MDDWLAALNPTLPSDSMAETVFSAAEVVKEEKDTGARTLSFPRAYSLALAPQIIHNRSKLLSQLVSSRSYRQVEFMAVGSFHILKPPKPAAKREQQTEIDTPGPVSSQSGRLSFARIPSTREDIFSTTTIPAKTKRALVKFLKFVAEHESEAQRAIWEPFADTPLQEFLRTESKLDDEARLYIITLTLSLDGHIGTRDGLAALYRHLSSMGMLGPGFAAVYPKWGGLSEIAQVACRAGAVGGGVYILGTGVKEVQRTADDERQLRLLLSDDVVVQTRFLVGAAASPNSETPLTKVSRLVTVVGSPLPSLFEPPVEGAPTPAVAVIALPAGTVTLENGQVSGSPIYVLVHSSDTGECPTLQCECPASTPGFEI